MIVPDCIVLLIACEEKSNRYMLPHPHPGLVCMEPCWACGEKRVSHTETDAENRCKHKKQLVPQAVLWKIKNRHTHIKRKKQQQRKKNKNAANY
jgi:hypothetical protein